MCRTIVAPYQVSCGICDTEHTLEIPLKQWRSFVAFNRNMERIPFVCCECQKTLDDFLCKTNGCYVLRDGEKEYCHRHDENSIMTWEKPKLIENFDD